MSSRRCVADQEFREPPPFETYWEGTCSVADPAGQIVGQAYVELNGFKRPAASGRVQAAL